MTLRVRSARCCDCYTRKQAGTDRIAWARDGGAEAEPERSLRTRSGGGTASSLPSMRQILSGSGGGLFVFFERKSAWPDEIRRGSARRSAENHEQYAEGQGEQSSLTNGVNGGTFLSQFIRQKKIIPNKILLLYRTFFSHLPNIFLSLTDQNSLTSAPEPVENTHFLLSLSI